MRFFLSEVVLFKFIYTRLSRLSYLRLSTCFKFIFINYEENQTGRDEITGMTDYRSLLTDIFRIFFHPEKFMQKLVKFLQI